jgi:enamine deaminase RidA (YjgF/YER057c/UK114 family)
MSTLRTLSSSTLSRGLRRVATRPAVPACSIHIEKKIDDLGLVLPPAPGPKANYNIVCHASGNMLYISGHLPVLPDGSMLTGRIGPAGQSLDHGYLAARHAGLNIVSTLKKQLGDLDRVKQVVKVCSTDSDQRRLSRSLLSTISKNCLQIRLGVWDCPVDGRLQGTAQSHGRLFRSHYGGLWAARRLPCSFRHWHEYLAPGYIRGSGGHCGDHPRVDGRRYNLI